MNRKPFFVLMLAFALQSPEPGFAWDAPGHQLVGSIAWSNMTSPGTAGSAALYMLPSQQQGDVGARRAGGRPGWKPVQARPGRRCIVAAYRAQALTISREAIALSGYRLADLLNQMFGF